MRCSACNADLDLASGERIGFRDSCDRCSADLHTCKNCTHHDPSAYNECRESSAERVSDRERANRCDYFSIDAAQGASAGEGSGGDARGGPLSDLEALFKK
jgi:hypothetical protein